MSRARSVFALVLALVACVLVAPPARAQVSASDAAVAEKLFSDARDLMAKGQYAEACPKFVDSERLDPAVGTLLNLAECYEKSGKTASAWAIYREAESAATRRGQAKRASFAANKARALAPDLAYLVIDTPDAPSGLQLTCDDKPLGGTSSGSPLPFDPGSHKVEAKAPGKVAWSSVVDLAAKATVHVAIPSLEAAPEPPPPPPIDAALPPPVERGPAGPPPGGAQRVTGIVVGAIGLVGVGVGSYFGLRAKAANDDSAGLCLPATCSQQGHDLRSTADDRATVSTFSFIVGGALLAAGAVVYFTAPRARKPPATIRAVGPWSSLAYAF